MAYLPKTLYGATGLSEDFRYALLIEVALTVAGVSWQLAIWTVLLKWTLSGIIFVGSCCVVVITHRSMPNVKRHSREDTDASSTCVLATEGFNDAEVC